MSSVPCDGVNLRLVFDLCGPVNSKISVDRLKVLFQEHMKQEQVLS